MKKILLSKLTTPLLLLFGMVIINMAAIGTYHEEPNILNGWEVHTKAHIQAREYVWGAETGAWTGTGFLNEGEQNQLKYIVGNFTAAYNDYKVNGTDITLTLYQGLLESGAAKGGSKLSNKYNNHFGIKCFGSGKLPNGKRDHRKCEAAGKCVNYKDDHPDDHFRVYSTTEEGYYDHGKVLKKERYQKRFRKVKNFKELARAVKAAGYASDPEYANKLIALENKFHLAETLHGMSDIELQIFGLGLIIYQHAVTND